MSEKPKKDSPVWMAIFLIILVGLMFMFGSMTCESFDEGRPFTIFGILLTIGTFVGIVLLVKEIMKGHDSDK